MIMRAVTQIVRMIRGLPRGVRVRNSVVDRILLVGWIRIGIDAVPRRRRVEDDLAHLAELAWLMRSIKITGIRSLNIY